MTPKEAAWVQTSASGWLSTDSGQVPISPGRITGPAGVGGGGEGVGGQESFKTPGGSASSLARPKHKGTCVHAYTCTLHHVYTGVFWVTRLSLDPFLPHWGLASCLGLAGP